MAGCVPGIQPVHDRSAEAHPPTWLWGCMERIIVAVESAVICKVVKKCPQREGSGRRILPIEECRFIVGLDDVDGIWPFVFRRRESLRAWTFCV